MDMLYMCTHKINFINKKNVAKAAGRLIPRKIENIEAKEEEKEEERKKLK